MRLRLLVAPFLVVGLAACTATPVPHEVPVRELTVPASLHRTHAAVSYSTALPAAADRPALLVGRSSEPGGPDRPTVWWSTNGAAWTQRPLGTPVAGELVDLVAGGDVLEAYVAGTTRSDGRSTPWLLRHTGGGDWKNVPLPDGVPANAALLGLAVTGGEAVLVVADTDRGWHAVRTGRDPSVTRLPDVGDDVRRDGPVVAAAGDSVVVLARQGGRDVARPVVAYRSPDRGSTWDDAVEAFGPDEAVLGTATDGLGFVASGWTRTGPGEPLRPAAWRSVDGVGWQPEPVEIPERLQDRLSRTDVTLVSPTKGLAIMTLDDLPYLMVLRRDAGRWVELAPTARLDTTAPGGVLTTVADRVVVGASGRDAGVIGSLSPYGWSEWTEHAANGEPVDPWLLYRAEETGSGPGLRVYSAVQTITPETWTVLPENQHLALSRSGLGATVSPPPSAAGAKAVLLARDDDGGQVVLAPSSYGDDATLDWSGWFSAAAGAQEQSFTLPSAGGDWLVAVEAGGPGWLAVGSTRPEARFTTDAVPAGWTSADGTTWTQTTLPVPDGVTGAALTDLCRWDDGTAVAVGGGTGPTGRSIALAWTVDASGAWAPVPAEAFGTGATLETCTDGDAAVGVVGSIGGRDTVWEVDRGGEADVVHQADDSDRLDDVARTATGLAVVGAVREDRYVGGVLDVRVDGEWVRTRVPVPYASSAVVTLVDDVAQTYWQTPTGVVGFGVDLADLRAGPG